MAKPEDYLGDIVKSLAVQLAQALSNTDEAREESEHWKQKFEEKLKAVGPTPDKPMLEEVKKQ